MARDRRQEVVAPQREETGVRHRADARRPRHVGTWPGRASDGERPRGDGLQLFTLGRDDFLAAVTGHATSAAEADIVVSTRLAALRPGVVKA